jgi:hypothetical protein
MGTGSRKRFGQRLALMNAGLVGESQVPYPPSAGGSCILKLFSVGCTGKIRGFLEWWFRPLPKVLYLFLYSACIQFEFGEPASAS